MRLVTGISMALLVVLVTLTVACASAVPLQIEPTPNIKHNGRSEMDIVGDGLEMLIKIARELERGAWAKVAGDAITSGEVRATVLGLADAVNKEAGSENVDK